MRRHLSFAGHLQGAAAEEGSLTHDLECASLLPTSGRAAREDSPHTCLLPDDAWNAEPPQMYARPPRSAIGIAAPRRGGRRALCSRRFIDAAHGPEPASRF